MNIHFIIKITDHHRKTRYLGGLFCFGWTNVNHYSFSTASDRVHAIPERVETVSCKQTAVEIELHTERGIQRAVESVPTESEYEAWFANCRVSR